MSEEHDNNFDLQALLKINSLDIRRVARNNLTLLVEDYYKMITKFFKYVPMTTDTLRKIAALKNAESDDFRNLSNIRTFLEDIGCNKFSTIIDEIASASKRGHHAFASESSKTLLDDFNELCALIKRTKTEKTEITIEDSATKDISFENYGKQTLKKIMSLLDFEEANRKMRILVVDDAPVIIKTTSSVLSNDYKVYGMTDPTKLEEFLKQITPELFLLDYKMPNRSGFELVPIIRSFEEHKDTPIIFLTSLGTADHVSAAFALGACDFIVKPFQGNIVREKIAKHIVRKKLF